MARRKSELGDKVAVDMTPMIDVVFQLMSFFMCTLKVVTPEGDFDIRMPLGAAAAAPNDQMVTLIRLKMSAAPNGQLAGLIMNGQPVRDFDDLQVKIVDVVGTARGPDSPAENTEVELDCDYGLDYENVVRAITAVSGTRKDGQVIELIKKIKFTPVKK
ncbi:MAG: ExbD/TolR family protein [Planctomycetia bacterium]